MKNKLFKTLAVFGLSFIAWNCSSDPASPPVQNSEATANVKPALEVDQSCWMLSAGTSIYLIVPNETAIYVVTDQYSVPVGFYDVATGVIVDNAGTPILNNVDITTLPVVNPDKTISFTDGSKATIDGQTLLLPGGIDPNAVNPGLGTITSSATIPVTFSSSSAAIPASAATAISSSQQAEPASSSSKPAESGKIGSITYTGSLNQTVSKGGTISTVKFSGLQGHPSRQSWNLWSINDSDCKFDESAKTFTINGTVSKDIAAGEVSETWILDGNAVTLTVNVTDGSGSTTKKSSSSQKQEQKSSSSVATQTKSSSSTAVASSASNNSGPSAKSKLKYISGGKSGSGFASRYWDCCKPHCSRPEHAHGNYSKQCTNKGTTTSTDWGAQSICSGGSMMTCTSQIPIVIDDSLAYAFAAVPAADGGSCGKCFALEFTGKGKYETKKSHTNLKGKILVVMATNVGSDVQQGQFDVMIPGGGVGLFNGCASMGWGNMGEQYGGLLSTCEKQYVNNITKRKECLIESCGKTFSSDAKAKEGCLFLANWMLAAGNPMHTYKEVECPAELKAQY